MPETNRTGAPSAWMLVLGVGVVALAGCLQPTATTPPAASSTPPAPVASTMAVVPGSAAPSTSAPASVAPRGPAPSAPAVTLPAVSAVRFSDPSRSAVTISWVVEGSSKGLESWVEYGRDAGVADVVTGHQTGTGPHEVGLDGVSGTYWFQVVARNAAGTVRSDVTGFTASGGNGQSMGSTQPGQPVPPCAYVAPEATNATKLKANTPTKYPVYTGTCPINFTATASTVAWGIAIDIGYRGLGNVSLQVFYGNTTGYGLKTIMLNTYSKAGATMIALTGLKAGDLYHMRVTAVDEFAHYVASEDLTQYA